MTNVVPWLFFGNDFVKGHLSAVPNNLEVLMNVELTNEPRATCSLVILTGLLSLTKLFDFLGLIFS